MTKKALPLLTGGLNEKTRSDLIKDEQLQVCTNYEIKGDGLLYRRKGVSEYDANLTTEIDNVFTSTTHISEPFYPQKPLTINDTEMESDFILVIYGYTGSAYELHAFFLSNNSWTNIINADGDTLNDLLSSADILYTSDSDPQIVIGSNKVIITDSVNKAHSISVDSDGVMTAGVMGIPSPTNKATVTEMTGWENEFFEIDSTASRLSDPGLFQCIYTVVTKDGEESNPSPLSDTLDMQFFQLDTDGIDERWLEKIEIKDLSIPVVSDNILETLKYFKVYMRVIRYSDGEEAKTLEFTQQFDILEKKDASGGILSYGVTGNDYSLAVAVSPGDIASYENDVAPIAKTAAEVGGITMLGNVKTKLGFPWDFKYLHPITINNLDASNYVDAVVRIRLWDKDALNYDDTATPIEHFQLTDFFSASTPTILESVSQHIRLFDTDMTTTIAVCHKQGDSVIGDGTANYIDLYIKIPLLSASSPHTIYLCWNPGDSQTDYIGVPSTYNISTSDFSSFRYGRFFEIGAHDWGNQQVWVNERVTADSKVLVDFDLTVPGLGDYIVNQADMYNVDEESDDQSDIVSSNNKIFLFDQLMDGNSWQQDITDWITLKPPLMVDANIANLGTVSFYLKYDIAFLYEPEFSSAQNNIFILWGKEGETSKIIILCVRHTDFNDSDSDIKYYITNNIFNTGDFVQFSEIPSATELTDAFFTFSWNISAETVALSVTTVDGSWKQEVSIAGTGIGLENTTFEQFSFYSRAPIIDRLHIYYNRYIGTSNNAGQNMANFMPAFDNMIGYDYSSHNNNITFNETKEIVEKTHTNMVKWTDVNYSSFPDLFFKQVREPIIRIMPAPSFLQFEYKNTFIIFTRNSINRFVLEGSADGWSGSSSSLIEEKTQYGLLAPKSLVKAGDSLFWLSEVGVMMWGKDGMGLISKNIVDVPIDENAIGFYSPLNNQYIILGYKFNENYTVPGNSYPVRTDSGAGDADNRPAIRTPGWYLNDNTGFPGFHTLGLEKGDGITLKGFDWNYGDNSGTYTVDEVEYVNNVSKKIYLDSSHELENHTYSAQGKVLTFLYQPGYAYHIERNAWTKFSGLDVASASSLTGGSQYDNINLLLDSNGVINKYPDGDTYTTSDAEIETKDLYFEKGALRRIKGDFTKGDDDVLLESVMTKDMADGTETTKTNTITNPNPNQWRGVSLGNSRGKKVSFKIKNADVVKSIMYDLKVEE